MYSRRWATLTQKAVLEKCHIQYLVNWVHIQPSQTCIYAHTHAYTHTYKLTHIYTHTLLEGYTSTGEECVEEIPSIC